MKAFFGGAVLRLQCVNRSCASNTISCVSRGTGAHEQRAAVTEPNMGGLHDHRHATQQDDLVARMGISLTALSDKWVTQARGANILTS